MVIDHALGIAGGAGGVVECDRAALVGRRRPGEMRIAVRDEFVILDRAEQLSRARIERIVHVDDERALLQLRQSRSDLSGELAVGNQDFGLAVLEDVGDRGGLEPRIDGVEHGAQHRHAVVRFHHRRHVGEHGRNSVACANPGRCKRRCQLPRPVVELAIGVSTRAVDHGDASGMDVRGARQERDRRQGREIGGVRLQAPENRAAAVVRTGLRMRSPEVAALGLAKTLAGRLRLAPFGHVLSSLGVIWLRQRASGMCSD